MTNRFEYVVKGTDFPCVVFEDKHVDGFPGFQRREIAGAMTRVDAKAIAAALNAINILAVSDSAPDFDEAKAFRDAIEELLEASREACVEVQYKSNFLRRLEIAVDNVRSKMP